MLSLVLGMAHGAALAVGEARLAAADILRRGGSNRADSSVQLSAGAAIPLH